MLTPVAAFYIYYDKNKKTDEELEKILRKDEYYQQKIQNNQKQRQEFQAFFDQLKTGKTAELDKKMNEMLAAGKSQSNAHQESNAARKRLYAVDESLLGTEEGARLAAENWEHAKQQQALVKQREKEARLGRKKQHQGEDISKKRKKKKKSVENEIPPELSAAVDSGANVHESKLIRTAAAAVATGTVLAVVASFLLKSSRSR